MALMAAHGEITPMPKAAIFADTQAEPPSVYEWLDWLEKQLPFPVERISAGNLEKRELIVRPSEKSGTMWRKSGVPMFTDDGISFGQLPRTCTTDFKVVPLQSRIRFLAKIARGSKDIKAVVWLGISTDEIRRMKPSQKPYIEHRFPLIEKRMSRNKCLEWMADNSYPKPPRSACVFCPYHSDKEWRRLKSEEPESFQRAVEFERQVQAASLCSTTARATPFLHASRKPLDQVDLRTDAERGQLSLWMDECEGHCGV
jgi:hypothetical protein